MEILPTPRRTAGEYWFRGVFGRGNTARRAPLLPVPELYIHAHMIYHQGVNVRWCELEKKSLLDGLVKKGLGYLKASDAVAAGVSRAYLGDYVRAAGLERVAAGLYRSQDAWDDGMYVLQTRYPEAVFSHETALFLLGLADREPDRFHVTLKTGASSSNLSRDGVRVSKVRADLLGLGLVEAESPFGHAIRSYDAERTICDVVRNRSNVDAQDLQGALKAYLRGRGRDVSRLMRYAKAFSVDKVMDRYLEVLL